jgi:hypothetical protein
LTAVKLTIGIKDDVGAGFGSVQSPLLSAATDPWAAGIYCGADV